MASVPPPNSDSVQSGETGGADRGDTKGSQEAAAQAAAGKALYRPEGTTHEQRFYQALKVVVQAQAQYMPKPEELNFGQLVRALKNWDEWSATYRTQKPKEAFQAGQSRHREVYDAYLTRIQTLYNKIAMERLEPVQLAPPVNLQQANALLDRIENRDGRGVTALARAVAAPNIDLEVIQRLIAWGADPNATDPIGVTPLVSAAEGGHDLVVDLLLKAGADLRLQNARGETALMRAARCGHVTVVKRLLDAGGDYKTRDKMGITPLNAISELGHQEIAVELLNRGADPNQADNPGRTALNFAVGKRDQAMVKLLLDRGAKVNHRTPLGWTPLDVAAMYGDIPMIELLLREGADIHSMSVGQIRNAQGAKTQQFLRRAMTTTPTPNDVKYGNFELHRAVAVGDTETVKKWIDRKANLNQVNSLGETALLLAVRAGQHGEEAVELLLKAGADPNIATSQFRDNTPPGTTALMWAAIGPIHPTRWTMVEQLLAAKADPNAVSKRGRSALHQAVIFGHPDTVEQLLEAGANPYLVDEQGQTAFTYAEANADKATAKLLLAALGEKS
jgi:ankyrin repeat protein